MRRRKNREENGFEEWGGYMNAKKAKLIEQFEAESTKAGLKVDDLFRGIKIFVNGYTEPSADELRILMMKHGGEYHHYHKTGITTHIIATNLPDSKVDQARLYKIVKPEWIVESIKANRLLNYQDFLLIKNRSNSQKALCFTSKPSNSPIKKDPMKCTTDEDFINEFYANSRLHHISTMGATFKEYINKLRSKKDHCYSGKEPLVQKYPSSEKDLGLGGRLIMHIDMDCFFVSVGLRDKPHLRGKPVAVTHSKGGSRTQRDGVELLKEIESYRKKLGYGVGESAGPSESKFSTSASMAEIASCSYEARQCGIKNGMFVGQALKLCPQLQFIHYDFDAYNEVSFCLYDSVASYTLDIEAVSCDEMYVDLTRLFEQISLPPMDFAKMLREEIWAKAGCPSSVGFGSNKLIARLATKKAKPNGQFWIQDDQVTFFLSELPVADLPGVGYSTSHKLKTLGVNTCGELESWSLQELQREFGKKHGESLYNACRGKEEKGLVFTHVRKSVSADVNYGIRLNSDNERDKFLLNLSGEVSKRLLSIQMKGRSVTLKLMVRSKDAPEESAKYMGHGICNHITKTISLLSPISTTQEINREVQKIVKRLNIDSRELRGIGIQMSRLEPAAVTNRLREFFAGDIKKIHSKPSTTLEPSTLRKEARKEPRNEHSTSEPMKNQLLEQNELKHSPAPRTKRKNSNEVDSFLSPADLRVMIRKWVESEEWPRERDKKLIRGYLLQLCSSHKLEELFLILKSFFVCVHRLRFNPKWTAAYQNILESVQTTVVAHFGARLKMGEYIFSSDEPRQWSPR